MRLLVSGVFNMKWDEIEGWFNWRSAQEEAVSHFPEGSCFVEVGAYLGRSLCSLAEVVTLSGKQLTLIGIDTCRGSGPEGQRQKDYHGSAVARGGGTFAGELHRNVLACGYVDLISLIIADSIDATKIFADESLDWVHLDASHDYEYLTKEIQAWLPKIRRGGWLSGDDYNELKWPSVVNAVRDAAPAAEPWSSFQWRLVVA
jgi:hypothetical protein